MTKATVWRNKTVSRVLVEGHSGYADNGSDIVCSSISTAMYLTCNIISKLTNKYEINIDENKVFINIKILSDDLYLSKIMESLLETLEDISSQFPKFFTIVMNDRD